MNRRRVAGHAAERGPTATTSGSPAAFHTLLSQQRHELGIPVAEALRCRRVRSADRKSECDFARSLPALPAIRDADAPDTCAGAHGDREAILLASGRLDRRANFGVGLPICVVSNEHLGGDVPDELAEDVGARAEDIDALFVRQRGRVRGHALRGDGRRGVHGDSVAAHPLVRAEGVRLVLVPAAALVLAAALHPHRSFAHHPGVHAPAAPAHAHAHRSPSPAGALSEATALALAILALPGGLAALALLALSLLGGPGIGLDGHAADLRAVEGRYGCFGFLGGAIRDDSHALPQEHAQKGRS
mmetsp:Transcript_96012/g.250306  ORF Transcript_96012/g.250306 Transcript_96012/m.250306 type:complete len:302 (-) Transcript_96012:169-1074(-)